MYEPNLKDRRVIRKLETAFGFAMAYLSTGGRPMGQRTLNSIIGQAQTPMAQWIRSNLITCTNHRFNMNTGVKKHWAYQTPGVIAVADMLGYPKFTYNTGSHISYHRQLEIFYRDYALDFLRNRYGDQLISGNFHYRNSSNRLWNGLQNVRRETRSIILAEYGYKYQYDIESCAPSLLYQEFLRNNHFIADFVDLKHIQKLLTDKATVRQQLSEQTGASSKQIKTVLTSMFCGAKLVPTKWHALYYVLDHDVELFEQVKNNPYIQGLQADIKNMWTGILHGLPVDSIDNSGKWQLYFEKERQVIDCLDQYMKNSNAYTFRIHDCLVSNHKFNTDHLTNHIRRNTGYELNLELKEYQ